MKKLLVVLLLLSQAFNTVYAVSLGDDLQVNMSTVPLNSRLKGEYVGYRFEILNTSEQTVDLVNAQIMNGQDGAIASSMVNDGSGVGKMWAVAGPAGLFTFGIAWLAGIVATPIMFAVDGSRNKKSRREGQAFSNIVDLGPLPAGASTEVQTLVPIGAKPQLKLSYKEPGSSEILMVTR